MSSRGRIRSVWVFHLNTGACNGCDIEIMDVLTPYYDVERLGVKLVGSPRHAHALLVTGPLTRQCVYAAIRAYEAMPPKPRLVIAVGTCACSGGIFYDSHSIYRRSALGNEYPRRGGIEEVLPVHMYIPGCPPRPEEIVYGLAQLVGLVEKRVSELRYYEVGNAGTDVEVVGDLHLRIMTDLRNSLRRIVGYFDRDKILRKFEEFVKQAKESGDERRVLHELVTKYCETEPDPRLRFCMTYLEKEYWSLRRYYEGRLPPPDIEPP